MCLTNQESLLFRFCFLFIKCKTDNQWCNHPSEVVATCWWSGGSCCWRGCRRRISRGTSWWSRAPRAPDSCCTRPGTPPTWRHSHVSPPPDPRDNRCAWGKQRTEWQTAPQTIVTVDGPEVCKASTALMRTHCVAWTLLTEQGSTGVNATVLTAENILQLNSDGFWGLSPIILAIMLTSDQQIKATESHFRFGLRRLTPSLTLAPLKADTCPWMALLMGVNNTQPYPVPHSYTWPR